MTEATRFKIIETLGKAQIKRAKRAKDLAASNEPNDIYNEGYYTGVGEAGQELLTLLSKIRVV